MKILNAGVRLFATIVCLGAAVNMGGIWWLLFAVNLLLFLAWAGMALSGEDDKGVTNE